MRTLALALVITFATTACAPRYATTTPAVFASAPKTLQTDPEVLASFARDLPAGSRVRVELKDGSTVKGTLMLAAADRIVVQRNGRVPEAARTIPVSAISTLRIDQGAGVGKAVAIGAAAGAGAAVATLLILIALLSD